METIQAQNLKQEAIKNGLIWGAINIVIFVAVYYISPAMMGSGWYGFGNILIGILLAIYFCKDLRTKTGGYWTFSTALMHITIMFLIVAACQYFFTIFFGKVIDTSYGQKMIDIVRPGMEDLFKSIGLADEQLDEAMMKADQDLQKQFNPTISQAIVGFGIVAIMYFVGALIFAAIFQKKTPMFVEEEND